MVIDFNRCSDMALMITRKLVSEFEPDQRGHDEATVFNAILRTVIDYENNASVRSLPQDARRNQPR
jgi:hypothetical protein